MAEFAVYYDSLEKTYHARELTPNMTQAEVTALVQQGLKHEIPFVRVEAEGSIAAINQVRTEDLLGVALTGGNKGPDVPPARGGFSAQLRHLPGGLTMPESVHRLSKQEEQELRDSLRANERLIAASGASGSVPKPVHDSEELPEAHPHPRWASRIDPSQLAAHPNKGKPHPQLLPDLAKPTRAELEALRKNIADNEHRITAPGDDELDKDLRALTHKPTSTPHPRIGPPSDSESTQELLDKLKLSQQQGGRGVSGDKK